MADQDLKSIFEQAAGSPDATDAVKNDGQDIKAIFQQAHDAPTPTDAVANQSLPEGQNWSKLQSAGQGALQGSTAGFSDEIGGAEGALQEKLLNALPGAKTDDKKSIKDLYKEYRDLNRQRNKQAEEANPKSYLGGNVAGAVGASLLAPELLAPKSIAGASALGAAAGLGTSNADLTDPSLQSVGQAAKDTSIGAGLGAVGGAIGNKLAAATNPEALETASSKLASSAAGLKPSKELTSIYNPVTGQMEKGSNVIKGIGSTALENGALPFTGGPAAMYDNSLQAINNKYQQLNPLLAKTQELLNPKLSDALEEVGPITTKTPEVMQDIFDSIPETSQRNSIVDTVSEQYSKYEAKLGQADGNLQALNEIKKELTNASKALSPQIYNNGTAKVEANLYKRLGGVVRQHIEDLASAADPGAGDQIGSINSDIGNLLTYNDSAKKLMDKSTSGLMDSAKTGGTAAVGFLAGGPIGAAITTGAKLAVESGTGNPIGRLAKIGAAKGFAQVAKVVDTPAGQLTQQIVQQTPSKILTNPFSQEKIQGKSTGIAKATQNSSNLYNATDDSLKDVATKFQQTPGLEFYADHLNKAIDTNDQAEKNRAIFLILQNPVARKLVTPQQEQ
jgi:hypothetical protein